MNDADKSYDLLFNFRGTDCPEKKNHENDENFIDALQTCIFLK